MALPKVVPISELRADAAGLVKCARESREPVIITQRGRATAVLMSIEDYNREIDRAQMIQSIMRGKAQARAGEKGYTLDEVMDRAKEIIAKYE